MRAQVALARCFLTERRTPAFLETKRTWTGWAAAHDGVGTPARGLQDASAPTGRATMGARRIDRTKAAAAIGNAALLTAGASSGGVGAQPLPKPSSSAAGRAGPSGGWHLSCHAKAAVPPRSSVRHSTSWCISMLWFDEARGVACQRLDCPDV